MSVTSEQASVQYTQANPDQGFSVPFYFMADADIAVTRTRDGIDEPLVLLTDYTVSGAGTNPPTGAILMDGGLADDVLTIYRAGPLTQTYDFTSNGPFPARTMTQKVDYLTMLCQQLQLSIARSLRVPVSNAEIDEMQLDDRVNGIIGFDEDGNLVFTDLAAFTASIQALVDEAQAAATMAAASQAAAAASQAAAIASAAAAAASAAAASAAVPGVVLPTYAAVRSIVTAGISTLNNTTRLVSIGGDYEVWWFHAGTNADDGANYLRPNDYNASTNAFVYQRIN
jgi:hypothetical protein